MAVRKWRPYLLGKQFKIKTDQQALKHILEQRIGTPLQQKWVSKLLGYDFTVEYKSGRENKVADALSRVNAEEKLAHVNALSTVQTDWVEGLKRIYLDDSELKELDQKYQKGELNISKYQWQNGLLFYKGRIHLGTLTPFQQQVLHEMHSSPLGGHMGTHKTIARIKKEFYWSGLRRAVRKYVRECDICQRNKTENQHPTRLLQPLPIPAQIWTDISMDFVEGLPTSQGKNVIMVVVDRLSKYSHFTALTHPYTAGKVARLFLDNIFKLHGMPSSIVSDRDPVFMSRFWHEMFRLHGTQLALSSAYHPQTDGQTEIVNKALEGYLRSFSGDRPKDWLRWLSLAEWSYNSSTHSSTKMSPFEAVYGYPPPK
jgi:hypothetical protein